MTTERAQVPHAAAEERFAPASRPSRRVRALNRGPALVLIGALLTQLALSVRFAAGGWFGVDALHYFAQRGGVPGDHESLFAPYGGHWQPVLISMYRGLFAVFGLHSYLPYVLPAICAHLLICALLYAIFRRLGVSAWVAVASAWLLVFYGTGSEAFISDAPFALTSALGLGVASIYLLVRWGPGWPSLTSAGLLTVAVMCSVTGVVAIIFVACYAFGTMGWRVAGRLAAFPSVAFLAWFAVAGRTGGRVQLTEVDPLALPGIVLTVLVKPLGDVSGIDGAGVILTVVVIAATFLITDAPPRLRALAWAGILAAATQLTLSALANSAIGPDAVGVGRYRYIVLVGLLPAVALTLRGLSSRFRDVSGGASKALPASIVVGILMGIAVNGLVDERAQASFYAALGRDFRAYTSGTLTAVDLDERMLTNQVTGSFVTGADLQRLAARSVRGKFPSDFSNSADRLHAESALFVGVGPWSFDLPGPGGLQSNDFTEPLPTNWGCRNYQATTPTPFLTFRNLQGAQIGVTSQSSVIRTRLVREGRESPVREWRVTPGQTVFIATTAELAELQVSFDAGGAYTLCRA